MATVRLRQSLGFAPVATRNPEGAAGIEVVLWCGPCGYRESRFGDPRDEQARARVFPGRGGKSRRSQQANACRRMHAVLGKSPLSYFQSLRVERAVQLLKTGNESVDQISARVGYADGVKWAMAHQRDSQSGLTFGILLLAPVRSLVRSFRGSALVYSASRQFDASASEGRRNNRWVGRAANNRGRDE